MSTFIIALLKIEHVCGVFGLRNFFRGNVTEDMWQDSLHLYFNSSKNDLTNCLTFVEQFFDNFLITGEQKIDTKKIRNE